MDIYFILWVIICYYSIFDYSFISDRAIEHVSKLTSCAFDNPLTLLLSSASDAVAGSSSALLLWSCHQVFLQGASAPSSEEWHLETKIMSTACPHWFWVFEASFDDLMQIRNESWLYRATEAESLGKHRGFCTELSIDHMWMRLHTPPGTGIHAEYSPQKKPDC